MSTSSLQIEPPPPPQVEPRGRQADTAIRPPTRLAAPRQASPPGVPARLPADQAQGNPPPAAPGGSRQVSRLLLPGVVLGGAVAGGLAWQAIATAGVVPAYVLPAPGAVAARWLALYNNGLLWHHASTTLLEGLLGFALAFVIGVGLGYPLARSRVLAGVLAPYVAASQAVPVIALAPLLVLWFGLGLLPKVLICALIVFFPILVNTAVGLRSIDRSLIEAAHSMGANAAQTLWYVEIPLALRTLLGGVKMGLTLAMTGAVVGEFVAANAGLGYLMTLARSNYDSPMLYAALLTLAALAVLGYAAVTALENLLIDWE
jgi:NitT/TauT family transport system permease protein